MLKPLRSSLIDRSSKYTVHGAATMLDSDWYFDYRKKFAKLKIQFELKMKESESLIREQLRIEDLSKRIQEQNEYVS